MKHLQISVMAIFLAVFAAGAGAQTYYEGTPDENFGIYPHLVNCKKCRKVRVVDTGNWTVADWRKCPCSVNKILSERMACKQCEIEFRVDRLPNPPAVPCPSPVTQP